VRKTPKIPAKLGIPIGIFLKIMLIKYMANTLYLVPLSQAKH